eukprot:ANDGO_05076.mRNA.1 CTD kinase subunit alpha
MSHASSSALAGSMRIGDYVLMEKVGDGTYGEVYRAHPVGKPEDLVALKRFKVEDSEGFPFTALREIKLLRSVSKEESSCVQLRDMFQFKDQTYMVFEFCDFDLVGYVKATKLTIAAPHIKFIFRQLLEGLAWLHSHGIIHRDIKAANILLTKGHKVRIADFGLGRFLPSLMQADPADFETAFQRASDESDQDAVRGCMTPRVVTRWYRAPEVLVDSKDYTTAVDIWSAGCILVEMFAKGQPFFAGESDMKQLETIFQIIGTPSEKEWPQQTSYRRLQMWPRSVFPNVFKVRLYGQGIRDEHAINLIMSMLTPNPAKRLTAQQCLDHPFFKSDPLPEPFPLPSGSCFEYQVRMNSMERQQHRAPISGGLPSFGGSGRPLGPSVVPPSQQRHPLPQQTTIPVGSQYAHQNRHQYQQSQPPLASVPSRGVHPMPLVSNVATSARPSTYAQNVNIGGAMSNVMKRLSGTDMVSAIGGSTGASSKRQHPDGNEQVQPDAKRPRY